MASATASAPAETSTAAANASASASRSRPQASRKRAHVPADDAAYHAPPSASGGAGTKRAAGERAEGEPRVKRKRADNSGGVAMGVSGSNGVAGTSASASANTVRRERVDTESKVSLIDFTTLPLPSIYEYLAQYDLIPDVDPSPLSAEDPPPPSFLLRPRSHSRRHASTASPGPTLPITPANRPRREVPSRRRSARLVEDQRGPEHSVTPILVDVEEVHTILATIAQRHFREHQVKEVDTLASFMCAVKAKA